MPIPPMSHPGPGPLWPIHYGPAPIPLRKEPHIPLTPKTGMRREEIERRIAEAGVTDAEKAAWNAKYAKPSTGIPKTDLASGVQASLDKADTALQEHQDISKKADLVGGKVPSSQLPSYVDDVLEFDSVSAFPASGEKGKLYVARDTNKVYRWTGTQYTEISPSPDLSGLLPKSDVVDPANATSSGKAADALTVKTALAGKSNSSHTHTTDDITDYVAPVQSDWNQTDSSAPDFIKNKPTIPAAQVQANWNETDTSSKAFIQNKPTIPTVPTNVSAFTNDAGYLTQHQSLSAYRTASAQDAIDAGKLNATGLTNNNGQLGALDFVTRYSFGFEGGKYITSPENSGAALTDNDIADSSSALGGALAEKANSSALAAVATTGDYADLNNKPTIPSAYGPFTAREEAVASQTREQTSYGKGGAATSDGNGNTWSSAFPKNSGTLALQEGIAPAFSASSTYAVGDYVTREGLLYKCTTSVTTAGAWNSANWSAVSAMAEMPAPGAPNHKVYAATATASQASGATVYAATTFGGDFSRDDMCVVVFMAPSAASGSSPQLNVDGTGARPIVYKDTSGYAGVPASEITTGKVCFCQFRTGNDITGKNIWVLLGWEKANLKSPEFTGTPTAPTANAGTNTTQIATTAFVQTAVAGKADAAALRYAFASPTPSVSGTAATVACEDRAINDFTVATGITSLTITPPAAVTGRARDFFCRVTLTDSSLPTVTISGGTIDIGATEVAGMTQGVNLLMFTEIASGHWLASRRSAS